MGDPFDCLPASLTTYRIFGTLQLEMGLLFHFSQAESASNDG